MSDAQKEIVSVQGLVKHFPIKKGVFGKAAGHVHAVNGVTFSIKKGESLGLVGESGCGKTTLGKCVLLLQRPTDGEIVFDGIRMDSLDERQLRRHRPRFQMIFQDPFSTLNPRMSVEAMLTEPLALYTAMNKSQRKTRVDELLHTVGLRPELRYRYPHEFSGGQRQRLAVARALTLEPSLIVCDEPVSALDVSVQAQILNLLDRLKTQFGFSYLFISHDLGVVEHIADRIAVMYLGQIVEMATDIDICQKPLHPYTKALMAAIPLPVADAGRRQSVQLGGDVPSPIELPGGCYFHPRCASAMPICRTEKPVNRRLPGDREVACHLY